MRAAVDIVSLIPPSVTGVLVRGLAKLLGVLFGTPGFDLTSILRTDARILEVGSVDFSLGNSLHASGYARYLALSTAAANGDLQAVRDRHPTLAPRIFAYTTPTQLARNNAQVLVFSDPAVRQDWRIRKNRHAEYLVWAPGSGIDGWVATVNFLRDMRTRKWRERLQLVGVSSWDDGSGTPRLLLAARILLRKQSKGRYFISPMMGVEGFLRSLDAQGLRYVVLRWFDTLPHVPPGEDLDLLVADADAHVVEQMLADQPGLIACDVYSVSGLPGSAYHRMAYYPPRIAEQILERSVTHPAGFRIPSPHDHFRSLTYHAVYHKGELSGLPTAFEEVQPAATPEHDYAGALASLATTLGIDVHISMEHLDEYLASVGWRPPLDALGRLAVKNRWLRRRLSDLVGGDAGQYHGLTVFFIRQGAVRHGFQDDVIGMISAEGFHVIKVKELSTEAARQIQRHARGGNWVAGGSFPSSGGGPAIALAVFDAAPTPPDPKHLTKHPGLDNARILVKHRIRDQLNDRLAAPERCNMLHSSDSAVEAREYLRLAFADELDEILSAAERLRQRSVGLDDALRPATPAGKGG